jgi:xylulokinase
MTGFTAPKLLWMARHEPDLYARVRGVMLPKDYVRFRLGGERVTDVTDASGTLWLDVRERAWSARVLEALEVDPAWLPAVLESPDAAGAGDQGAGAVGVGAVAPGVQSVVLGTSGVVLGTHAGYVADGVVQASAHAVPGRWFAMGVILSAAGSLRWLRDALCARDGLRPPYDQLLAEAERWPPGVDGLTFLPYLTGERTPHFDPQARGAFAGLEVRHDRGALVRAVLEGVAYALADAADLVGGDARVARVSGGGARSELWLRIVASVLQTPLERVAVDEGAAYGAALLGGVSGGIWSTVDEAVDACVRVRETIDPTADWTETYQAGRTRYRALYPALASR